MERRVTRIGTVVVGVGLLLVVALAGAVPADGAGDAAATPVGGLTVEPSRDALQLGGCVVAPRPPEERDGLVRAMAGFRCASNAARRNVTVELWQLDGTGFWQPVPETDETFATAPGMGSGGQPSGPRRSLPLGPDEISCRATPLGVLHRFRTYAAAFGPNGEPLLHAGTEATLPRDCLAGMAAEHAAVLGIPPDSNRRFRLPPREFLRVEPVCPAFLLSPRPVPPEDCPGGIAEAATPVP